MEKLLIIEDTESLRDVLCAVLISEGYKVTGVGTAEEAEALLKTNRYSLVLTDLRLPGTSGIELLKVIKVQQPEIPVVVMTAYGTIDIAVDAMKFGAADFITKPFDPPQLCSFIKQVIKHNRIVHREPLAPEKQARDLVTQSPAMERLLHQALRVAPLSSTVLLLGESGVGKELVARYIYQQSRRAEREFVAVNCGSLPEELLESEFFGHDAGAFTGATTERIGLFEVAHGGTVFLDEIGNMSPQLQVKLLRTLQESEIKRLGSNKIRKVDVRIIAATNCNLEEEMKKGRFREDLYYRLGVVVLEIPPLRDRPEDIELLANYFLQRQGHGNKNPLETRDGESAARVSGKQTQRLSAETLAILRSYHWPGNVRELENVIERAAIFSPDGITPESLQLFGDGAETDMSAPTMSLTELGAKAARIAETEALTRVLAETGGNKSRAAKILGISYKTLLNKVKEYQLETVDKLPAL